MRPKGDVVASFEVADAAGRQPGLVPSGAGGVRRDAASGSSTLRQARPSSPSLPRSHGVGARSLPILGQAP